MSKNASISVMQQVILDYIEARIPKDQNKARRGIVHGKKVIIGNQSYNYDPAVDMYFKDGDNVYCLLPDSGRIAAVVGVA